ncbi:MAG: DUF445 family protein [Clostridia bacterium]
MDNLLPILASMSVGGVIGYSTNWIAIKMLFRPLHEIRVLGFKLPFTPGVIPKQRNALGTSIGKTVENYLLTHDSVSETINSATFQSSIKDMIESNLVKQTKSAKTLRQLFSKSNINKKTISTSLHNITLNNRRAFVKAISKFCDLFVKNMSLITFNEFFRAKNGEYFTFLKEDFEDLFSNIFHNMNDNLDKNLRINDLLTQSTKENMENMVTNLLPTIIERIAKICENEEAKDYLYKIINKFLSDSFLGSIVKNFVPEKSLKNIAAESLQKQLRDEQTLEQIYELLPRIYKKVYSTKVSTISNFLKENEHGISSLSSSLIVYFLNEYLVSIKNKSIIDVFSDFNIDTNKKLKIFLISQFEALIEDKNSFNEKVSPIIDSFLDLKIAPMIEFFLSYLDILIITLMRAVERIVDLYGENVLEAFDVKKMVETQIEKLDLLQVEDIILSVMNNQLKAITWFGLLLGALLGLLMPLLNNLLQ